MKLMKRTGVYQARNVTFNPETCAAFSYVWWQFMARIKGKVVFNNYGYSNSTRKHQSKVRSLLQELGIKIDRVVQVRHGLQNINTIKELNTLEKETLQGRAEAAEAKRKERNRKAQERRALAKEARTLALHESQESHRQAVSCE
jgi:hypothetical protein